MYAVLVGSEMWRRDRWKGLKTKREAITYLSLAYKKQLKYRYSPNPNHIVNTIVDIVTQARKNLSVFSYSCVMYRYAMNVQLMITSIATIIKV